MYRSNKFFLFLILSCFISFCGWSQSKDFIEVTGQLLNEDGGEPLLGIVVEVMGKDRGVVSNSNGMFSIVVDRGDRLRFKALGFKESYYTVPETLEGKYHSFKKYLTIDTFIIDEVTIRMMTPEEFDFAFKYNYTPDPNVVALQNNMNADVQSIMINSMKRNYLENQKMQQMNNALQYGSQYGQPYTSHLGDPRAWQQFVDAWKRGDFRGRK